MIRASAQIVSGLIGGFYDSAYEPDRWPESIESLRRVLGGSTACFVREGPNLRLSDAIGANTDIAFQELYIRDFAQEKNFLQDAFAAVQVGEAFRPQQITAPEILRGDRFWHDWMLPQDMHHGLVSKLLVSGPSLWFVDIHRGASSSDFHADDVELFTLLTPHIRRAAEMGRNFQTAQAMATTFSNLPFGVILVDGHQRILRSNQAAEAIFSRRKSALCVKSGTLSATDPRGDTLLRQAIDNVLSQRRGPIPGLGDDFMLMERRPHPAPDLRLAVSVGPFPRSDTDRILIEPCAIVVVHEMTFEISPGLVEHAQQLFKLTAKEAQLAAALAAGYSLKQAAEDGNITFSTARSHLERIFTKTGMRQQSQLVALLKNLHPWPPR